MATRKADKRDNRGKVPVTINIDGAGIELLERYKGQEFIKENATAVYKLVMERLHEIYQVQQQAD